MRTDFAYEIRDASGVLVALHQRHEEPDGSKRFTWRQPDGTPGLGGLPVVDLPLFGIERLDGLAPRVVLVEGEKCVEALRRVGIEAVGTVTGAATTPSATVLAELGGRRVILWPDADAVGRKHMAVIAERLAGVAASVSFVEPPEGVPAGWDAADAVAEGRDVEAILRAARPFEPKRGVGGADAPFDAGQVEIADDPTLLPPPSEPMRVANRLVDERFGGEGDGLLLRQWQGEFWRWHASHWLPMADAALRAEAYRYTEHAVYLKLAKGTETLEPWAPNRYRIADLLEALRAVTYLSDAVEMPAWLDAHDRLPAAEFVACANGLLHVPTRALLAHDRAFFNRVAVPFPYEADPPPPIRWLTFLDELWHDDPEAVDALAEFMGYVISGRRDLHKILLLIGPTRAGKGVIARVLKALVGRGNYAGPTLASLGTNFGLSPLIGKPLAIVSDARLGGGANVPQVVERLLSISGEDMLTVDVKFREPWTGTLPTRFVVISNELPRFGDASGAIAGRFLVLTLHNSWLGRENPALTDELLTELPGILNWALEGLAGLHERGRFTEPASSRDAVVTLADLVSPTSAFVRDRCEVGPASEVPCDQLYAAWKAWAEDNGHRAGSSSTFGRDLRAVLPGLRSIRPRTDDRQRLYRGVRLATNHTAPVHGPAWTGPPVEPVVQDGPADRPFRSEGTEPFAASADPSLEPALGADLDDWLAAPSGDQLSLADDWGTIG